jgi:hypothetical protein
MVHVTAKLKLRSCFETKSTKNCLLDRLTLHILIFFVITRCYVKILCSSWNSAIEAAARARERPGHPPFIGV